MLSMKPPLHDLNFFQPNDPRAATHHVPIRREIRQIPGVVMREVQQEPNARQEIFIDNVLLHYLDEEGEILKRGKLYDCD